MPRKARIHLVPLHSSLVNLPMSMYGPLVERDVRPQSLAIHLNLTSSTQHENIRKVEAFVGWTGMGANSSLVHSSKSQTDGISDTIEIDPQYAQGLGFSQNDIVEIGLLYDLSFAKTITAEPLTSDDWEIIEINASHIESVLLSQVRVAKIGQEIDVWVLGRTRVRLRIVSLDSSQKGDALLLTTSTEVAIVPKTHGKVPPGRSADGTSAKRVDDPGEASAQAKRKDRPNFILRVIPKRLLLVTIPEDGGPDIITYVAPRTFNEIASSNNHKGYLTGTLVKLNPPADPSALNSGPTSTAVPEPTTRVLAPGGKGKENEETEKIKMVYITPLSGVPEGHIFVPLPHENVEEWDIVCLTVVSDETNREPRLPQPEDGVIQATPVRQQLVGVDDILKESLGFCIRSFFLQSQMSHVSGVPGLLLTGGRGFGKTSIVQAIAKSLQEDSRTLTYIHYVDVSRYSDKPVATINAQFKYWAEKTAWHRPSVLILDNLDKLLSAEVEHKNPFRSRQLNELFVHIYSSSARTFARNFRGILLLATATSKSDLHAIVNKSHIFQEVVKLYPPSKQVRKQILAQIVNERLHIAQDIKEDPEAPLNYAALAIQTDGYTAVDLRDLVARAFHQAAIRLAKSGQQSYLNVDDFVAAQTDFVPTSLRDIPLQKSSTSWSDIGGLHETRRILRETLEWPTKYGPIFAQSPIRLRSGLLLYGYPGCGKTLLASAVAKECGLNFISVKGPELLNKYIGASEKSVRDLFERAVAAKPCVLFFDEFDSIAPKRGHDSTGVTDRVVNQMLTQMDGAEGLEGVYVLAATSRPDLIDSALLRPGRLDKMLLCDMPNQEERKDILEAISKKVPMSADVDLNGVAAATEGFSGADLQALLYSAQLEVVHESIDMEASPDQSTKMEEEEPIEYVTFGPSSGTLKSKEEEMSLQTRLRQIRITQQSNGRDATKSVKKSLKKREIKIEHIHKVRETMMPSVSVEERRRLGRIYQGFISDRKGGLPLPSESRDVGSRVTLA